MDNMPTPNDVKFRATMKNVEKSEGLGKEKFVPKPHLTHRPFVNSDLAAMRNSLAKRNVNRGAKR